MQDVIIRQADINDIDTVTELENSCFPVSEAADRKAFELRLRNYPECFRLLEIDGKVISMINGMTTNAVLPGISRRSVHLCCAPGGQIQCVRQDMDISSMGRVGCSSEYTTFSFFTLRLRHSIRITFARGQTLVL